MGTDKDYFFLKQGGLMLLSSFLKSSIIEWKKEMNKMPF